MTTEAIINKVRDNLKDDIVEINIKSNVRALVSIKPEAVQKAYDLLFSEMGFRFIIASALQSKEGIEIYYHFSKDIIGLILNLHVLLPKDNPQIESLADKYVAANWIEREMHELYGIKFLNHPNLEKLISDGNWAEGVYPYKEE